MQATINYQNKTYKINLNQPIDISIPLEEGMKTVNAFYAPPLHIEPVRAGDFVGDVKQGGVVNFKNVHFNPHGNGTHTECLGHISPNGETINQTLKTFFFIGKLISIYPQKLENGDNVITCQQLVEAIGEQEQKQELQAIIIRTMPNDVLKKRTNYSGANPPYMHHKAAQYLADKKIPHLLLDLPSVDRAEDEGKLLAHKAFWQYPNNPRYKATITELIYVSNEVKDGIYWVNMMISSWELDASPSKIILYKPIK